MKVLFIGGTGNISTSVSSLAVERGIDLYLLNRGQHKVALEGVKHIPGDINRPAQVHSALKGQQFDAVVNWIAFNADDIERDIALFEGRTRQYVFISSASAYQKPPTHPVITESTPLYNPFWAYSQNKIRCEERLAQAYRERGFPMTIVRPSLTYDTTFPIAIGGWGCYTLADRLLKGQEIIVHGDGSSLWTVTPKTWKDGGRTAGRTHLRMFRMLAAEQQSIRPVLIGQFRHDIHQLFVAPNVAPLIFGHLLDVTGFRTAVFQDSVHFGIDASHNCENSVY